MLLLALVLVLVAAAADVRTLAIALLLIKGGGGVGDGRAGIWESVAGGYGREKVALVSRLTRYPNTSTSDLAFAGYRSPNRNPKLMIQLLSFLPRAPISLTRLVPSVIP